MESSTNKYPSYYSLGEEIANSITHGLAAALSVAACVVMIVTAVLTRDPWKIVSSSIYGGTLILLFTMSTLYHAFPTGKVKSLFRVFDHAAIFMLISGSYTPFTLVTLRGNLGWILFGISWGSTIVGVILNAISVDRYAKFSMICYLAGGWSVVFAIKPLLNSMEMGGIILLVSGGLAYTVGVIFFKLRQKYMHSIWHMFVFAGSALQYFCVLFYVIMK